MLLYIHEMHLTHLPGEGEANNHNSVGLRFLDLSFNRLSEGNCARILAGAVKGPLEGLDLGTSNQSFLKTATDVNDIIDSIICRW
jgi:hypothetical protein